MLTEPVFKLFETITEDEMEEAMDFVFSRESQEYLTTGSHLDDIDPQEYVFIFDRNSFGTNHIVGLFSPTFNEGVTCLEGDGTTHILENALCMDDLRLDSSLSVADKKRIIEKIQVLDFKFQRYDFPQKIRYVVFMPEPDKLEFFSTLRQAQHSGQPVCYAIF
jgi:hypothetical protein